MHFSLANLTQWLHQDDDRQSLGEPAPERDAPLLSEPGLSAFCPDLTHELTVEFARLG